MSNPSPRTPEAQLHPSDADAQSQAEYFEQELEGIDLNDPQPSTESQTPGRKKLSARDILERLGRRRLEIAQISFTAGSTPAGKGSHGEVVVATITLNDGTSSKSVDQVAVKKFLLRENIDEEKFLRTFANELHVLDGLDHPNIIKLVGFVEDMTNRNVWLVFPWEANGNVREFLQSGSGKWELPERVSLIQDVADGLEYLHSRQPPIRHGDLKSLNILVNSDHRAVITDFGSARIQSEARGFETLGGSPRRQPASTDPTVTVDDGCPELTVSTVNAQLTLTGPSWSFRWAAPEILNEEEPCLASDIWALGWIAWEVVTDNYPFPEAKTNKLITVKVITGLLPSLYDDSQLSQIGSLCDVMARCWKSEPKDRLSAAECRRALQWVPSAVPRTVGEGIPQIRSAALLVEMGEVHRLHSRNREAVKFFEEASALAQSTGEKGMMARALDLSAESYRMLDDYDKAEEACNQSLAIYMTIDDRDGRASALRKLGMIHQDQSNYGKAEECFKEALALFTSTGSSLGRANVLRWLGEIHLARSNYAKAEDSFNQALSIFTCMGSNLSQANVLEGLGQVHEAQSNHAKAEEYSTQALAIFKSVGYTHGQASALEMLGRINRARHDYAKAEEYFKQALAIYNITGDNHGRANSLVGLGEVLVCQGRPSEAKSFLHDAAEVASQINYNWARNRSKRLLTDVLEAEKSLIETLL